MKMVCFTALDGSLVFVNAENVSAVYTDSDGDTVIHADGGIKVCVNCDIMTAVEKLQGEV